MGVKASGGISFSRVPSVESETRYFLLAESSSTAPSKPTTVPPTGGWTQTEPTYDGKSTTGVLYTCVLTKFTNDTFSYSEVSVSSSYEVSKSAYNQAHEANQKLASWCSKTDTTLFDGAKIATGSVTTEALDAKCVTADKIDTADLFSQNITASGKIKSSNYNGTDSAPLGNTEGSILNMADGTFNFGGGKLVLEVTDDGPVLTVDGRISGKNIFIEGNNSVTEKNGAVLEVANKIETKVNTTSGTMTMTVSQECTDDEDESWGAALIFENGVLTLSGAVNADIVGEYQTWPYKEFADTSGLSGVFTAGQLTVTKKMGVCWISGTITLSKSISGWKTILNSDMVPPPQHKTLVPFTVSQWSSSYTQPLRGKILANGGLQIQGGAAKEYVFTLSYPID